MPFRPPPAIIVLIPLLSGCGPDPGAVETCRRVIGAFEQDPAGLEIGQGAADPADPDGVIIDYATENDGPRWIACRFSSHRVENAPLEPTRVATSETGELSEMRLFFLKRWLGLDIPLARVAVEGSTPALEDPGRTTALYAAQQAVNGLVLGCIYALLAVGFSLVYGIIGRINFAFGELMMLGAYQTVIAAVLFMASAGSPWTLPLVLLTAAGLTAGQGWLMDRLVFRPLRRASTQVPLIAAIGTAIALQEGVRLLQGGRDRWLAPVLTGRITLAGSSGFPVTISIGQVLIVALTLACSAGLWWLLTRTPFGRSNRACGDDRAMAELLGVDTERTIGGTFALGAACAGAAGFVVALQYGGVNAYMGTLLGFKALTAAIVGGIGSIPGAFLGGLLIALLETGWAAWFPMAFKDVAVFALLIAVLVARPTGLLGVEREEVKRSGGG
ncbi:branched-chain amino acid transporter permease subunit LivH [Skermanella stibiiresistens SB22]|uniref:Branched-chain amino acid transporter permease subunit LivH n=1 Tax=Skermanella stibiiresistens SB22 TaxID=1385369 RepID=W9H4C6_9PROT|nr:branched-chain amino acid ABC transporter permease [Skermanella stibiiresistens]EWY39611.1 branched-chain amino acid transporter permease subunit LivH [Skermanella stibiiresistens SB22]